jgi:hydrogenase nickel incorporation protein HypA/HybF
MHELKIAEDLVKIVLDAATKEGLKKVFTVNVCFGEMIQIVPEIFEFAFTETVRDTIAFNAIIDIEIVPVKLKCKDCGNEFGLSGNMFFCPVCSSADIEILQGKELYVKSIEGE